MSEKNAFELSRRKALASLGAVGVASAGAGLGTSAYFSDTESFDDNTITAGELDLKVDWQQLYWGMPYDHDQAPYGTAGRPFVNAHPDHDGDGMQSLDLGDFNEGEFGSEDNVVRYVEGDSGDDDNWSVKDVESGANIQEYLTCETLNNFDDSASFKNDNGYEPDSLIHLEDVKPGDCGEITFSYHLCDNPGYVWMLADLAEGVDTALAEAIQVNLWYDLNCNNVYDSDQDLYVFSQGSLNDLLTDLGGGHQLDPTAYDMDSPTVDSGSTANTGDGCVRVGKVDVKEDGTLSEISGGTKPGTDTNTVNFGETADAPTWSDVDTYESRDVTVKIEFTEFKDSNAEPISFEASVTDSDPQYGICSVRVKGGGGPNKESSFDEQHVFGANNEDCVLDTGEVETDIRKNGKQTAISNIQFSICDLNGDDRPAPNPCFPAGNTFCVGLNWCLPVDVDVEGIDGIDDINDLQGLSASFDLGFYTEQCRHNGSPDGPPNET